VEARARTSWPADQLHLDLDVPAVPWAVSEVRQALERLSLPGPVLDDARLLVSELLSNSIRHAGLHADDRIRVLATISGSRLRLDVLDRTHVVGPAGPTRPSPGAESGWGLYLVNYLSARCGWGPEGYWFELPIQPGPRARMTS
jgi:anti-sigma regulatory factor (Ser/Thr protein kinase)